jgi:hypothetical protein
MPGVYAKDTKVPVDLIGEHEVADEAAATEKARVLYEAFHRAMASIPHPGFILPVASVAPHPFARAGPEEAPER